MDFASFVCEGGTETNDAFALIGVERAVDEVELAAGPGNLSGDGGFGTDLAK